VFVAMTGMTRGAVLYLSAMIDPFVATCCPMRADLPAPIYSDQCMTAMLQAASKEHGDDFIPILKTCAK
jgi:hypothetical protein